MGNSAIGVWLIGARGSISSTVFLGAAALNKQLVKSTGMMSESDCFAQLDLVPVSQMIFGGCDIRSGSIVESAREIIASTNCMTMADFGLVEDDLLKVQDNIGYGSTRNCGEAIEGLADNSEHVCPHHSTLLEEVQYHRTQLQNFKKSNNLETVIVVNLSSTEPPLPFASCHNDALLFEEAVAANDETVVRASTLYAYAAILEGCPYINFTPSNAALPPALVSLAEEKGVPVMGNDGKTGETLIKSALAPMFKARNLEIMSWEGFNILGNMDGKVLGHPENCVSKLESKDQVLKNILGYTPHSNVSINYVPSLGDQKTAWDFVHFKGFMESKMSLQFTWQGFDSLLAAPLVLDMVRFAELAKRRSEFGLMPQLASFFKAPLGCGEHGFSEQYALLRKYAEK